MNHIAVVRSKFERHMLALNACARLARQKTDGTYRTISVERNWVLYQAAYEAGFFDSDLVSEVVRMRDAIDSIYRHNAAARAAVITHYGTTHSPCVVNLNTEQS